jgi:hypothetical protein
MTTLNLDTDVADRALVQMKATQIQFRDAMNSLRNKVFTEIRACGDWRGVSAHDFLEGFNELSGDFTSKIDANWVELMEILDKEIVQWKEKGEKLLDVS